MHHFATNLSLWLLDAYVAATVVSVAALLILCVVRQPVRRITLVWAAAVGLWAAVLLSLAPDSLRWKLGWMPVQTEDDFGFDLNQAVANRGEAGIGRVNANAAPNVSPKLSPPIVRHDFANRIVFSPTLLYSGMAVCMAVWLLLGSWQARRLLKRSRDAPACVQRQWSDIKEGRRSRTRVRVSGEVDQPLALGLFRPVILLPVDMTTLGDLFSLRAALKHEWTHILHGDLWLLAAFRWLAIPLAMHPGYWLLRRLCRFDQEVLADAAAHGDTPIQYAQLLLRWSRQRHARTGQWVLAMAGAGHLKRRIRWLLRGGEVQSNAPKTWFGAMASFAAATVLLSLVSVQGETMSSSPPGPLHPPLTARPSPSWGSYVLPGGVEVELVGIQCSPRRSDELLVSVNNPRQVDFDWTLPPSAVRRLPSTNKHQDQFAISLDQLQRNSSHARLRLGVSFGAWRTLSTWRCASTDEFHDVLFYLCADANDEAVVAVCHSAGDQQLRVLAMDDCGQWLCPSTVIGGEGRLTATFMGLPIHMAQEFVVQTRSQAWIDVIAPTDQLPLGSNAERDTTPNPS